MKRLLIDLQHSLVQAPEHQHAHLCCEMVYVRRGRARFTIAGQDYTAGPGCLLFISSLEAHQVRVLTEPYERYFAIVSLAELNRAFPHSALTAVFVSRPQGFSHCVPLQGEKAAADAIFSRLTEEYARDLEAHFAEPLTVAELAARFYVSPGHLAHSVRALAGYSPKQYLRLLRLSYAKELLETTEASVAEIALRSGFSDVNNFIRAFRLRYGEAPGRFRRRTE